MSFSKIQFNSPLPSQLLLQLPISHSFASSFPLLRIFNSAHGAGEAIRGTFNDGVDQLGEGIAGAGSSDKEAAERKAKLAEKEGGTKEGNGDVAQKGMDEVKEGLGKLQGSTK